MKKYTRTWIVIGLLLIASVAYATTVRDKMTFTGPVTFTGDVTEAGAKTSTGAQTFTGTVAISGDTTATGAFTVNTSIDTTGPIRNTGATIVDKVAADPCSGSGYAEGAMFYNDTGNYMCFCDGTNDLKFENITSACF